MSRPPGSRLAVAILAAVLTALAGLAALASLAAFERTEGWRTRLAGEMTVAIRPSPTADADAARAAEVLAGAPGVAEARVLDRSKVGALLAPWTAGARPPDLAALPRLIAVDLDPRRPAQRQDLAAALNTAGVNALVEDHQGWIRPAVELRQRSAAVLVGALMLCAAGLAAAGAFAAMHETRRSEAGLRTRLRLGATLSFCILPIARTISADLGAGVLAGGLVAALLARLSGLAAAGTLATGFGLLAGVMAAAFLIAATCAVATTIRRIAELES